METDVARNLETIYNTHSGISSSAVECQPIDGRLTGRLDDSFSLSKEILYDSFWFCFRTLFFAHRTKHLDAWHADIHVISLQVSIYEDVAIFAFILVGIKFSQVDGTLQVVGWVIPAFTCSCNSRTFFHIDNRNHLRVALVCTYINVVANQTGGIAQVLFNSPFLIGKSNFIFIFFYIAIV